MGLLDSVIGAMTNNAQGNGGLQDLIGMVGANPKLIEAATSLLANDGGTGGLSGLVAKFEQAGLGAVVGSWIASGPNPPVSADQLSSVLGSETMSRLGAKLGLDRADAASQLSKILPGIVDKLTPTGQAPAGGLGNAGDLVSALGSLLKS